MKRNEDSLRDIWDNIECTSIHITEGPKEEREKGPKNIFEEIIAENFSNMGKESRLSPGSTNSPMQDEPC